MTWIKTVSLFLQQKGEKPGFREKDTKYHISMGENWLYRDWWCKALYVNGDNFTEDEDSKHYMSMGTILQRMMIQNIICQWGKTAFTDNDDTKNHMSMARKQVSDRKLIHSTIYQSGGKLAPERMMMQSTIYQMVKNCFRDNDLQSTIKL